MSARALTAARLGMREQSRRPVFVFLLVFLPLYFIARSISVTEPIPRLIGLPGGGMVQTTMREIHGADMALIAVGFLIGLCGVYLMLAAREADRRLVVAGFSAGEAILARLLVLLAATVLVVTVAIAATAWKFDVQQWLAFAGAIALVGVIYGAIGALVGALLGRISAVYLMFFAPMIDLGIAQNPMFGDGSPSGWAQALPGWAPTRVAIDAAFSHSFHAGTELLIAAGWALALLGLVAVVLRRSFSAST
jgi:ABC-2 type transport system permease protein